ncbi:MAG: hypothetical protein ACOCYE_05275 [Pseudomonadota bacterium]
MITAAVALLLDQAGIENDVQLFTSEAMLDLVRRGEHGVSVVYWRPEMTGHPDLRLSSQFHSKTSTTYQG